jgi:hypothetical protein
MKSKNVRLFSVWSYYEDILLYCTVGPATYLNLKAIFDLPLEREGGGLKHGSLTKDN